MGEHDDGRRRGGSGADPGAGDWPAPPGGQPAAGRPSGWDPPSGQPGAGQQPGVSAPAGPPPPAPGGPPPGGGAPPGGGGAASGSPAPGGSAPGWGPPPQRGWSPAPVLRPGIVPLRPLSLGELYDGAFQALRTNPRTMLGVTAVVVSVVALVDLLVNVLVADSLAALVGLTEPGREVTSADLDSVFGTLEVVGVGAVVSLLASLVGLSVVTGLLTFAVSQAVLGRRVPIGELWRRTRGRLVALVALTLLIMLAYVGAVLVVVLPGLLLLAVLTPLGVVALLLAVPGALALLGWLYGRLALATPALLLEDQPVLGAWRRSWTLTRGSFWRVLGIVLLTAVITAVTVAIVTAPFLVLSTVIAAMSPQDPLAAASATWPQLLLQAAGSIISSTIVYPFTASVTALLYIDVRMRREGLDVQLARAAQGPAGG